jgi:hypothetical protein
VVRGILGLCLVLLLLVCGNEAEAGQLVDRLAEFPRWEGKPPVSPARGDLIYPAWMEGNWQVTSILVDQVAPLAPEVVTPGFEGNRRHLNEPVSFEVRFQAVPKNGLMPKIQAQKTPKLNSTEIVADRAFNGLSIGKAYLGESSIQSVKVDPASPNRQITSLSSGRQLISIVTGRGSETPNPDQFVATEVSNQVFRGNSTPYFNEVETTTKYWRSLIPHLTIEADQITAVYLSPQDADYFKALNRPVALYRYRLQLKAVETK